MTSNTTLAANFCGSDLKDEYKFVIDAIDTDIVIDLTGIPSGCDYDVYLYKLTDMSSPVASSEKNGSANEHIQYSPSQTGEYLVYVYAATKCGSSATANYGLQCIFE